MKATTALAGGLTGAITLNLIHELYRQIDPDAPKVHLVGEEALVKMLKTANLPRPSTEKELYTWTLTGDILSNTIYYSLIGLSKKKNLIRNGLLTGFAAGVGAVFMPEKMGLDDAPVARTTETKLLTVLWYTLGGLTAGGVMRLLRK